MSKAVVDSLLVDSTERATAYVDGTCELGPTLGAEAGTCRFVLTGIEPAYNDEVELYLDLAAGSTLMFRGHVVATEETEVGLSGEQEYLVRCLGLKHDMARQKISVSIGRGTASAAATAVLGQVSGYSLDGASDTGGNVGPFAFESRFAPEALDEICEAAGMLWRLDYANKTVILYSPGNFTGPSFDRSQEDQYKGLAHSTFGPVINRVLVEGMDGKLVKREDSSSQSSYGVLDHPASPLNYGQYDREADLQAIGDAHLRPSPAERGTFETGKLDPDLLPGAEITLTDANRGMSAETFNVAGVSWAQDQNSVWAATVQYTSESLVSRVAAAVSSARIAKPAGLPGLPPLPDFNLPSPRPVVQHTGPIRSPDTTEATPSTGETFVHFRYNPTNQHFRMVFRTAKTTDVYFGFRIVLRAQSAITVTRTLESTETGEDVEIEGSGTRKVIVYSTLSGSHGRWSVNNDLDRLRLEISGDDAGATAEVTLRNMAGAEEITRVTYGAENLRANVSMLKPVAFTVQLAPQVDPAAVAEGRIDKQLAGGDTHSDLYDDSSGTTQLTDNANRRRTQSFREFDGVTEKLPSEMIDGQERSVGVLTSGADGVKDDRKLGTGGLRVRSGGGLGTSGQEGMDTSARFRHRLFDGVSERTMGEAVDWTERAGLGLTSLGNVDAATKVGGDSGERADDTAEGGTRARTGLNGSGEVSLDIKSGGLILVNLSSKELRNTTVVNNSAIGAVSPQTPNKVRGGANRSLEYIDTDGNFLGAIKEGVTALRVGSNTYGLNIAGDGAAVTRDDGQGGGSGSGDAGGGSLAA